MIANVVYSRRRVQLRVFIYRILVLERGISPCICLMRVYGTECWRLNLVSWTVIVLQARAYDLNSNSRRTNLLPSLFTSR